MRGFTASHFHMELMPSLGMTVMWNWCHWSLYSKPIWLHTHLASWKSEYGKQCLCSCLYSNLSVMTRCLGQNLFMFNITLCFQKSCIKELIMSDVEVCCIKLMRIMKSWIYFKGDDVPSAAPVASGPMDINTAIQEVKKLLNLLRSSMLEEVTLRCLSKH